MTQEQSEAIQKALDTARAAQEAYEEAVRNLEDAIEDATDLTWVDLRGVDLGEHGIFREGVVRYPPKRPLAEL